MTGQTISACRVEYILNGGLKVYAYVINVLS